jgi:hypothetical protein
MKLGLATVFLVGCNLTPAQVASDVEVILGAACTVAAQQPSDPAYVVLACTILGQIDGSGTPVPARTIMVKVPKARVAGFLAANSGDAGAP